MTYRQALKTFRRDIASRIPRGDKPACREAWNNWTDSLHKDGRITSRQYDTWSGPKSCSTKGRR
jgi:hypothetical protein